MIGQEGMDQFLWIERITTLHMIIRILYFTLYLQKIDLIKSGFAMNVLHLIMAVYNEEE